MVPALFLSVFCDIHEESFFAEFFFIYIYVGLQSSVAYPPPPPYNDSLEGFKLVTDIMKLYISSRSGRSELERIFLYIPPPGT
jgi:hypothetical protein